MFDKVGQISHAPLSTPSEFEVRPIFSLGGCVVHDAVRRVSPAAAEWSAHYWRRPTIALMSPPAAFFNFDFGELPREYANYFANDVAGKHLFELETLPRDQTAVTEFTRDIFTAVLEIEPGVFVMDPVDAVDAIDDIKSDNMNREVLGRLLKDRAVPRLSAYDDDTEPFMVEWRRAADAFLDFLTARNRHTLVLELYFTKKALCFGEDFEFGAEKADKANAVLTQMYDHVRGRRDVELITIDRKALVSGTDVAWTGPTHTHYVDEAYALLASGVEDVLTGVHRPVHQPLLEASLARGRRSEKTAADLREALSAAESLTGELEAAKAELQRLTQAHAEEIARMSIIADDLRSRLETHLATAQVTSTFQDLGDLPDRVEARMSTIADDLRSSLETQLATARIASNSQDSGDLSDRIEARMSTIADGLRSSLETQLAAAHATSNLHDLDTLPDRIGARMAPLVNELRELIESRTLAATTGTGDEEHAAALRAADERAEALGVLVASLASSIAVLERQNDSAFARDQRMRSERARPPIARLRRVIARLTRAYRRPAA